MRHTPFRAVAALLIALAAAACAESPAASPASKAQFTTLNPAPWVPRGQYGMNMNPCNGEGDSLCVARELDVAQQAGVQWIRMTLYWDKIQPWGATDTDPMLNPVVMADLQRTVRLANARGISVMFILFGTPDWARLCGHPDVPDCGSVTSPPHDAMWVSWGRFVEQMAIAFPTVSYFSVWNEPNSTDFFTPHPGHTAIQDYYTLVDYAAQVLHARGRYVVGGEVAAKPNRVDFVRELHASQGHHLDVMAVHHYGTANDIISWTNDVVALMDQAGRPRIPIWVTEYGHGVEDANDADQAAVITKVLDAMNDGTNPYWQKSFPYILELTPRRFLEFNADGTVNHYRSAYYCYQAVSSGQFRIPDCSYNSGT